MSSSKSRENIINYIGPIDFDTIGNLIGLLKEKIFEKKVKQTTYKKLLMILIESLENVFKYNDTFAKDPEILITYSPEFLIFKQDKKYHVTCSNTVLKKDIPALRKKLSDIIKLDRAGVRKLYKERITDGQFSEKGGAGLGMIEMAKITDKKINFRFDPINNKYSKYTLILVVNSS